MPPVEKCAYCGKERPTSEMNQGTIIFQDGHYIGRKFKRFVNRKTNWYCADKPCHSHDQMAHEG
jgi:hypothetical protein